MKSTCKLGAFCNCIIWKIWYDKDRNMKIKHVTERSRLDMKTTENGLARPINPMTEDGVHVEAESVTPNFTEYMDAQGMMHYSGGLGEFSYNPNEFELQKVKVPQTMQGEDLPHDGEMYVLRYIGTETNGNKIHIPEGITSIDLMFTNTNIKSAPKIPMGVESMFATFASCHQMETANINIPPTVKAGEFMFTDCQRLKTGPSVIPGTIDNANYMFAACHELQNTPKIGRGVQQGEYMFAGCEKLTKEPNVPRSMVEYKNMTIGCKGIDEEKDRQAQLQLEKDRHKYIDKLNRKSLMSQIGSGFSFAMQVHAMRQSGYNMLMAPVMVHQMRKNGQLSRTFAGGVAANMMTKGGVQGILGMQLAQKSYDNEVKKQEQNKQRLTNWDNAHASGQGTAKDLQAQTRANKDLKRGLFTRMGQVSAEEKNMYRQMYDQNYTLRENMMQKLDSSNMLDSRSKQAMSKWYQQQMSSCATYYAEGMRSIQNDKSLNPVERKRAMDGLKEVSRLQMEPLMQSAENIQKQYQIFNEGDLRNIRNLTKDMPSEKAKGMDFVQRIGETKQETIQGMMGHVQQSMLRNMQRTASNQTSRAEQAQQKFGHMGQSSQSSDYEFQ